MKAIITSDWHLDWHTAGLSRWNDLAEKVREMVAWAASDQVDFVFFLGDLANPDGADAIRAGAFACEMASELARHRIQSRWLTGNHDVIEDGRGGHTMMALQAAVSPTIRYKRKLIAKQAWRVVSEPIVEQLTALDGSHLIVAYFPFVPSSHEYDPEEFVGSWNEVARSIGGERVQLALGHLSIGRMHPGSEEIDMPRGRKVMLPLEEISKLEERPLVFNGHYHEQQTVEREGVEVFVPGSLERLTFGEENHAQKGYILLEIETEC